MHQATPPSEDALKDPRHVLVIGGGIIGAPVAYFLSHEGDGVALAPITGQIVEGLMAGKAPHLPGVDLSRYLPARMGL